ncbi:MAG: DUF2157 domain-containing protein [Deltaproteobacteria bacterium]|nr:DUF2157 domain-containing protein [Deltaproteobacteria bacterium]
MEAQRLILQWAEDGVLPADRVPEGLEVAGVTPNIQDWKRFLDRLLPWSGTAFLAVGIIFFLAYNWNELGHSFKFGLVEMLKRIIQHPDRAQPLPFFSRHAINLAST